MSSNRYYSCVLCSSRPKVRDRRPLVGPKNKQLPKFLHQRFFIEHSKIFNSGSVICKKRRIRCSREMNAAIGHSKKFNRQNLDPNNETEYVSSTKQAKTTPRSPPSITLPIPSVGGRHSQCAVCKRCGPKLVVVPTNARHNLFWTNFWYCLLELDAALDICPTMSSILKQQNRFLNLDVHPYL